MDLQRVFSYTLYEVRRLGSIDCICFTTSANCELYCSSGTWQIQRRHLLSKCLPTSVAHSQVVCLRKGGDLWKSYLDLNGLLSFTEWGGNGFIFHWLFWI